jgi:hypothetical protein
MSQKQKFEGLGLLGAGLAIVLGISMLFGAGETKEGSKDRPASCEAEAGWVSCKAKVIDSSESGLKNRVTLMTQSGEYITVMTRRRYSPTPEFQVWNLKKQGEEILEMELSSKQPKEARLVCARGERDSSNQTVRYLSPLSRYPGTASLKDGVEGLAYNQPGMAVIEPDGLVSETRPRTEFEQNDCSTQGL